MTGSWRYVTSWANQNPSSCIKSTASFHNTLWSVLMLSSFICLGFWKLYPLFICMDGQYSSKFVICVVFLFVIRVVLLLIVMFCVLFMCNCVLPPGVNPTAVDKYINFVRRSDVSNSCYMPPPPRCYLISLIIFGLQYKLRNIYKVCVETLRRETIRKI
jgi:hypothetical protein